MSRIARLLVIALLGAAPLAGCGGSDPESSAPTPTPASTAASGDWHEQVAARCKAFADADATASKQYDEAVAKSAQAAQDAFQARLPEVQKLVSDLKQIQVPADVARPYSELILAIQVRISFARATVEAHLHDATTPRAVRQAFRKAKRKVKPFVKEYSLKDCLPQY